MAVLHSASVGRDAATTRAVLVARLTATVTGSARRSGSNRADAAAIVIEMLPGATGSATPAAANWAATATATPAQLTRTVALGSRRDTAAAHTRACTPNIAHTIAGWGWRGMLVANTAS